MKAKTLLLLRISLGLFLVVWGVDKLINTGHGIAVSDGFYLGIFSVPALMAAFGVVEVALGILVVLGLGRRIAYPALLVITGVSLLAVWKSILDPLGLVLSGTNLLFFPSLIIFAAALVLATLVEEDTLALDRRSSAVM